MSAVAGITNLSRLRKRNPLHSLVKLATPGWEILWTWLWVVVLGAPTISDKGNIPRKLLTTHRTLIVDLTTLSKQFERCNSREKFEELSSKFDALRMAYNKYYANLQPLTEFSTLDQLTGRIVEVYENCYFSYDECCMRLNKRFHDEVEASDSASQTTERTSTSSKLARHIDLDKKLAELKVAAELAEAREAKMLARAEKAETLAKLRLEEARVEAEQAGLVRCCF